jgi:hypothetical protein
MKMPLLKLMRAASLFAKDSVEQLQAKIYTRKFDI